MRPHVAAVYAFARAADDFADEPGRPPERTSAAARSMAGPDSTVPRSGQSAEDPVFRALGNTIRTCSLPVQFSTICSAPFGRTSPSIATRRGTTSSTTAAARRTLSDGWSCESPESNDADADRASDALCTALQLTNFWQDFGVDWNNGRLYIPREEFARHGALEADLASGRMTPGWKAALAGSVDVTRGTVRRRTSGHIVRERPSEVRAARHLARRQARSRQGRAIRVRHL